MRACSSLPPLPHPCFSFVSLQYDMMADFRNMSVAGGSAPAEKQQQQPGEGGQAEGGADATPSAGAATATAAAASQQDEVVGTGG